MIGCKSVRFNNSILNDAILRYRLDVLLIFLLGLLVATVGLFNHEFVQFESRFGLFAQEMMRNGISFFPTTYNKFYPDYPATQTILTYCFSQLTGRVTIYTAVLPSAIAAACTLVFTYLIAATVSKRWGFYAVLLTLFTYGFLVEARTISLDQFTTMATACCFYSVYTAKIYHASRRLWLIPIALLVGFIFRGPIGLIIPASVAGGFYLLEKEWKKFFLLAGGAIVLLAIGMLGLMVAAWHEGGRELVDKVILMQITGRMDTATAPPFYYYLTALFSSYLLVFPLALVVYIVYAKQCWRPGDDRALQLLRHTACWLLIVLLGMSIPAAKKVRYILPIVPALALAAAYLFSERTNSSVIKGLRKGMVSLCLCLPYLGLVMVGCGLLISHFKGVSLGIHYGYAIPLFLLQIVVSQWRQKKLFWQHETLALVVGAAAFVTIYIYIVQPINIEFNQGKSFVMQVEAIRQPGQALVFYKIGPDGEDIKYMVALDKPLQPQFVQTPAELLAYQSPAVFIAAKKQFFALPVLLQAHFKMLADGQLGHLPAIAFQSIAATKNKFPLKDL